MDEHTVSLAQAVGRVEAGIEELLRMNRVTTEAVQAQSARITALEQLRWKMGGAMGVAMTIGGVIGRFVLGG
jgi:hypothetical protein